MTPTDAEMLYDYFPDTYPPHAGDRWRPVDDVIEDARHTAQLIFQHRLQTGEPATPDIWRNAVLEASPRLQSDPKGLVELFLPEGIEISNLHPDVQDYLDEERDGSTSLFMDAVGDAAFMVECGVEELLAAPGAYQNEAKVRTRLRVRPGRVEILSVQFTHLGEVHDDVRREDFYPNPSPDLIS